MVGKTQNIPTFDARTGVDVNQVRQIKEQMNAMIQAEVRQTAKEIFVGLVVPFLQQMQSGGIPSRQMGEIMKDYASLAYKAAPYLHQAAGVVQINDAQIWEDAAITPTPQESPQTD